MDHLYALIGTERPVLEAYDELAAAIASLAAPVVGAFHITCSDESEHEDAEAFRRNFASKLLPRLGHGASVPFRIANPGARYEEGSLAICEDHFATPDSASSFKVLLVKINGHVAVSGPAENPRFGFLERYGNESTCCGAIHAVLAGSTLPFVEQMRQALKAGGVDRLAPFGEGGAMARAHGPLSLAMLHAGMQARRVVADIEQHEPKTPTLYVVVHGVTLNRSGSDGDLIGGVHVVDRRTSPSKRSYRGLGEDASRYRLALEGDRIRLSEDTGGDAPAR